MLRSLAIIGSSVFAMAVSGAALAQSKVSDEQIEKALWQAYKAQPGRVVCVEQTNLGTRQPKSTCGTLEEWFSARDSGEMAQNRPQSKLVEQIKKNKRKASLAQR